MVCGQNALVPVVQKNTVAAIIVAALPAHKGVHPAALGVQAALSRPYLVSGVNGTLRVLRFGQRVDFGKGAGGKFPQIRLHERQRGVDVADKLLLAAIKAPPFGYKKTRHIGRAK